jgi:hypothetical protein
MLRVENNLCYRIECIVVILVDSRSTSTNTLHKHNDTMIGEACLKSELCRRGQMTVFKGFRDLRRMSCLVSFFSAREEGDEGL